MDIRKISIGESPPKDVNALIEIPQGGVPVKYELDNESGALRVDRFLMFYPGNYGFIPHTLSGDGDPVDVRRGTATMSHEASSPRRRRVAGRQGRNSQRSRDRRRALVLVVLGVYRRMSRRCLLPELVAQRAAKDLADIGLR